MQTGQFHKLEALMQLPAHHQGNGLPRQTAGQQGAQPPTGFTAGGNADQRDVMPSQAAGHQPGEAQMMGPEGTAILAKQPLELLVNTGLQHGAIVTAHWRWRARQ